MIGDYNFYRLNTPAVPLLAEPVTPAAGRALMYDGTGLYFGGPVTIVENEAQLIAAALFPGTILIKGEITITDYLHLVREHTILSSFEYYFSGSQVESKLILDKADVASQVIFVGASNVEVSRLKITSAQALNGGVDHAGIAFESMPLRGLRIRNNDLTNLHTGIRKSGSATSPFLEDSDISENRMTKLSGWGISMLHNVRNVRLANNVIRQKSGSEAHAVDGAGEGIEIGLHCYNMRVIDNDVADCPNGFGIELFFCDRSQCTGNSVFNCRFGISIAGTADLAESNFISLCGRTGNPGSLEFVGKDHIGRDNQLSSEADVYYAISEVTDEGGGNIGLTMSAEEIHVIQPTDVITVGYAVVAGYNGTYTIISKTATKLVVAGTFAGTSIANITKISASCICGIAVNADFGATAPDTCVKLIGNTINKFTFAIQLYTDDAKVAGVKNCLIVENTIYGLLPTFSIGSAGVRLQNSGAASDTKISNNVIERNHFIGGFEGCVSHYNGGINRVKFNTHCGALEAGETLTHNNMAYLHPNTGGKVWTDDITLQTSAGGGVYPASGWTDSFNNTRFEP